MPAPLDPGPAGLLALQRTAGNQAVARAVAEAAPPQDETLEQLEERWMNEDVQEIVGLLSEQILTSSEEARIVKIVRRWVDVDAEHPEGATPHLDKLLFKLKTKVFTRRTARSGWIETWVNAYDTCWHELEDHNLDEFRRLVARSERHGTTGPESGPSENLWATLGKHEAMGVWGMLKGLGLVVAGVADAAVWAYWKTSGLPLRLALEQMGVKDADKAPSISPYLSKSYDEVGKLMGDAMGVDPTKDETLLGQSSYEIGEFGGKIVGLLTMAGVGAGGAGTNLAGGAKAMSVIGALKGIDDAGANIAKRLEEMQKRTPPPTLGEIFTDEVILLEVANILANVLGAAAGPGDAAPAFAEALKRFGWVADAAQLAPVVAKLYKDFNDPELAKNPEARDAALRDGVATILGTILAFGATKGDEAIKEAEKQRLEQQQQFNADFDARYNAGGEEAAAGPAEYTGETYDHSKRYDVNDPHQAAALGKLQELIHSTLAAEGPDSLVKVVPAHYDPMTEVSGYVVQQKFVAGRTPEQLASILGVAALKDGVTVYQVDLGSVTPDMIQPRGYTQSSGGKSPNLSTPENLAKYPVGQGTPQWQLPKVPATPLGGAGKGEVFKPGKTP